MALVDIIAYLKNGTAKSSVQNYYKTFENVYEKRDFADSYLESSSIIERKLRVKQRFELAKNVYGIRIVKKQTAQSLIYPSEFNRIATCFS